MVLDDEVIECVLWYMLVVMVLIDEFCVVCGVKVIICVLCECL